MVDASWRELGRDLASDPADGPRLVCIVDGDAQHGYEELLLAHVGREVRRERELLDGARQGANTLRSLGERIEVLFLHLRDMSESLRVATASIEALRDSLAIVRPIAQDFKVLCVAALPAPRAARRTGTAERHHMPWRHTYPANPGQTIQPTRPLIGE